MRFEGMAPDVEAHSVFEEDATNVRKGLLRRQAEHANAFVGRFPVRLRYSSTDQSR